MNGTVFRNREVFILFAAKSFLRSSIFKDTRLLFNFDYSFRILVSYYTVITYKN